ncbi:ImmA/IrrE family metallo-endopeptidase [Paenibacillus sp. GCM10027626]|uniref:ImmA/IrrE family metallo-endopeptidase n=1 Tax=Paenibacillus sp. GCM10027626 TaxID=3273411 RepID=UPI00363868A2
MYEQLLTLAEESGLNVYEKELPSGLKGLYADGIIWINKAQSYIAKGCILAEEIGHYRTSSGDILDQTSLTARKQELRARRCGHTILIPLARIVQAGKAGVEGRHSIAEWLEVTEEFLQESIDFYKQKYGIYATSGEYAVHFDPLYVSMVNNWTDIRPMRY